MKRICIYHSRDLDGYTSGAIVKYRYPDTQLIGYDYGQPFPELNLAEDKQDEVIMIDVSIPAAQMAELAKKCKFTWIDHHVSAIDELNNFMSAGGDMGAVMSSFLKVGEAACELGWKYFFPQYPMPYAVKLLGAYDTWRNHDIGMWEGQILPFQYGMRRICQSPEQFDVRLFNTEGFEKAEYITEGLIGEGMLILEYQREQNAVACKRAFDLKLGEFNCIALNGGGFNSMVFDSVYTEEKYDLMFSFAFNGKFWTVSLYTTKDIDCSVIAKSYGGGGHAKAAGFQLDTIGMINLLEGR